MPPRFLVALPGIMAFPSTDMGTSVGGAGFEGMRGKSVFEMLWGIQVELLNRQLGIIFKGEKLGDMHLGVFGLAAVLKVIGLEKIIKGEYMVV